jgi:hypothetical protein
VKRLAAIALLALSTAACNPAQVARYAPHVEGPKDEMTCRTKDGHIFHTGQAEANALHLICDHAGMGEG